MKPFSGCWSSPWRSGRGDTPLFTYAVTIQNHQAYTAGKYGFVPDPPETTVSLSDAASTYLSVYFKGLQDSANMLERLTQYLDSLDESLSSGVFGDHQPNLGGNYLAYRGAGSNLRLHRHCGGHPAAPHRTPTSSGAMPPPARPRPSGPGPGAEPAGKPSAATTWERLPASWPGSKGMTATWIF